MPIYSDNAGNVWLHPPATEEERAAYARVAPVVDGLERAARCLRVRGPWTRGPIGVRIDSDGRIFVHVDEADYRRLVPDMAGMGSQAWPANEWQPPHLHLSCMHLDGENSVELSCIAPLPWVPEPAITDDPLIGSTYPHGPVS